MDVKQEEGTSLSLETLIKIMPHYVAWKDVHSTYLGCNHNFSNLVALNTSQTVLGKQSSDFLDPSDASSLDQYDADVIKTGASVIEKKVSLSFPLKKKGTYLLTCIPVCKTGGKVEGVLSILYDTVEENEKEISTVVDQAISDFFASINHDLRTPLNSIIMSSQFLLENTQEEDNKELVAAIAKSSESLLRLVESILDFTELESGRLDLRFDPFDLREIAEKVINRMAYKAREKNVALILSYNEFVPRHVKGDPFYINRILINLIDNAIKFTQTGYVLVRFDGYKLDEDTVNLSILVKDTGIGIEKESLQYIFERFARLAPTYKGHHRGTSGLGLSTVKALVEKMDGYISVTSQPQQGSSFTVTLPFKKQQVIPRRSIWGRHYTGLSVLVVDDLPARGQVILKQMGSDKSRLIRSNEALEVLEQLRQESQVYDTVLVDSQLSAVNPLVLAKRIKEEKGFENSILVYMTEPCPLSSLTEAKQAGFSTIITKPVKPSDLIHGLENAWGAWLLARKGSPHLLDGLNPVVLLVEQDVLLQKILKLVLSEFGCIVDVYAHYEPERLLGEKTYDIMVFDPEGVDQKLIEIVKILREKEDKSNPIPIVLIMERLKKKEERYLSKLGPNYFVNKPIDPLELKNSLIQCLFRQVGGVFDGV